MFGGGDQRILFLPGQRCSDQAIRPPCGLGFKQSPNESRKKRNYGWLVGNRHMNESGYVVAPYQPIIVGGSSACITCVIFWGLGLTYAMDRAPPEKKYALP